MVSHTNDVYTHKRYTHKHRQGHTLIGTHADIHTLDILYNITKTSTKSTYSILNYAYNAILTSACLNSNISPWFPEHCSAVPPGGA